MRKEKNSMGGGGHRAVEGKVEEREGNPKRGKGGLSRTKGGHEHYALSGTKHYSFTFSPHCWVVVSGCLPC